MNGLESHRIDEWLTSAASAFSKAIVSKELTMLDQLLFIDQFMNLVVGNDVHFPTIPDKNVRRIRSDRLKILGYYYIPAETRWTKTPPDTTQSALPS